MKLLRSDLLVLASSLLLASLSSAASSSTSLLRTSRALEDAPGANAPAVAAPQALQGPDGVGGGNAAAAAPAGPVKPPLPKWCEVADDNANYVEGVGEAVKINIKPEAEFVKVVSKDAFTGGRLEVSVQAAAGMNGVITSIYLTSKDEMQLKDDYQLGQNDKVSFDLMSKNLTLVTTNFILDGGKDNQVPIDLGDAEKSIAEDKKYGWVWGTKSITWLMDGKEIRTETFENPPKPMHLVFSVWSTKYSGDDFKQIAGWTDWNIRGNPPAPMTAQAKVIRLPKSAAALDNAAAADETTAPASSTTTKKSKKKRNQRHEADGDEPKKQPKQEEGVVVAADASDAVKLRGPAAAADAAEEVQDGGNSKRRSKRSSSTAGSTETKDGQRA